MEREAGGERERERKSTHMGRMKAAGLGISTLCDVSYNFRKL